MHLYKANLDGSITRKSKDLNVKSGEEIAGTVKKGDLLLVTSVENLTEAKFPLPYKKYNLLSGKYVISVVYDDTERYTKASFADVPEYLFMQIQKPKVYITLGVVLVGLAIYSIVQERKNS